MGKRYEIATVGIDEALQGFSSDPFGSAFPSSVGLRVPSFVPSNANPQLNRYLFLLASRTIGRGETVRLRGWRQYLTLGISAPANTNVGSRPVEFEVVTPGFRFADGNVSWHLVREPLQGVAMNRPNTDLPSFMYRDSDTPSLLYASYSQSAPSGYYPVGLSSYVPPLDRLGTWEPVAGLGNVHDLRTKWRDPEVWENSLNVCVGGPARVSLYASVLQTNPNTRPAVNAPANQATGDPVEEDFIIRWNGQGPGGLEAGGVTYWRIAGSLIVEDC